MLRQFIVLWIFAGVLLVGEEKTAVFPPSTSQPAHSAYLPMIKKTRVFFVSKNGANTNGRSWATAWNELDQINWQTIQPGDIILIDGGPTNMVYTTFLNIQKSGTSQKPITIQLSQQTGHSGQAVFFGGRATPLPYCNQVGYVYQPGEPMYGINTNNHAWVVIDGSKWSGIAIHGYRRNGLYIDRDSTNILVRHLEIYDNGFAAESQSGEGWVPDSPGVRLGGKNITLERTLIHDNGQDAIQSLWGDNNLQNFTLRQSWLYNGRQHPHINESSNYCRHADGLQIYDGGLIKGITIEESIIGPGLTQALMLGQLPNASGAQADVQDVAISHVLFFKGADNGVIGYTDTNTQNWQIDHATFHCPNTKGHCLRINNPTHSITNSIFYDAKITFHDGLNSYHGNCQWLTEGFNIGETVDPQFTRITSDPFSLDDYQLKSGSPCRGKGSTITSVQQLLSLPDTD